jgi:putative transposase
MKTPVTKQIDTFSPSRERVDIQVGSYVRNSNTVCRIAQILDFDSVIGIEVESGRSVLLRIAELKAVEGDAATPTMDFEEIADPDWQVAEKRFAAIRPLIETLPLDRFALKSEEVMQRAKDVGVDRATLYRWLQRYRATGSVLSLIPQKAGWKRGNGRISVFAENIINEVIRSVYLTPQRPTAQKAVLEVLRRCREHCIEPPSPETIRTRLRRIPERERLRGRGYKEKAKNKFLPAAGSFPNADYPLAVVQIDHTPVDLILVDDVHRKPIGRPWITLAIDVFSRMITGYYLSFDAPSETSIAMCVAHSILPKEEWLILHKTDAQWPVWGIPRTIHVDNGSDFRSDNFRQACLAYGIHLEFRPVGQPRYGGHIERVLGTLLKEIHDLPGTTFSSIREKDGYDSEKHSAMTKSEFEEWLVGLICKVYHQRLHTGIGMSPQKKWEIGIFGNAETDGVGMPPRPGDKHTVLLDFLPSFWRTVQPIGVTIENMNYYADVLRPWISAEKPESPGNKREFVFRRDPRDISCVWFRDPELNQYFKIPLADQSMPSMSVWEYKQVKAKLRTEGTKSIHNSEILRALTELRTKVEESKAKSKKARRQAQRRAEHEKKVSPAQPSPDPQSAVKVPPTPPLHGLVSGLIDDFGDFK